jgi:hypothetical protein
LHTRDADGIQVAIEHEGTPTTCPARHGNDVGPPWHRLVERDLETSTTKPTGDEVGNLLLTRTSRDQIWIDRINGYQLSYKLSHVAHAAILPVQACSRARQQQEPEEHAPGSWLS